MEKYVPLDAVFNHVPDVVKNNLSAIQIRSWAAQAYARLDISGNKEIDCVVLEIENFKAPLPADLSSIKGVDYSDATMFEAESLLYSSEAVVREVSVDKYILYQQIWFDHLARTHRTLPLLYRGQFRSKMIENTLYCNDCTVGFTVDKKLTCLTIDLPDGSILLTYERPVRESDDLLIPDDSLLLGGLGLYVTAMFWQNRAYTHEQNAMNFYNDALMKSEHMLKSFQGRYKGKQVDVASQRQFVFNRNKFGL